MTDREILELILRKVNDIEGKANDIEGKLNDIEGKVNGIEEKVNDIEEKVSRLKRQVLKSTAELKAMDEIILDEVERVHDILDKHKEDKSKHIA